MIGGTDLQGLADAMGVELRGSNAVVQGVSIDSRKVAAGDLFVALRGEHVDGHDFLAQAAGNGAIAAMVETPQAVDIAQLVVDQCETALGRIAAYNRSRFAGEVVAVTGSAGKTSCKNLIAAILGQCAAVHATVGNLNNEIGLPLTVLGINEGHGYAVLEMGAAKSGDIAYLCDIGKPTVALLTNVNQAHIGGFGSLRETAATKGEIFQSLSASGVAVINADDDFADYWRELTGDRKTIEFSLVDSGATVYASQINASLAGVDFMLNIGNQACAVQLPLLGEHNVRNALAAAAVAHALAIDINVIANGLRSVVPEKGRLQLLQGKNSLQLLDDSYNANPEAARAAIDVLASCGGRTIAVFGEMGELGDQAAQCHYELGQYAAAAGINRLYAVGGHAGQTVAGFGSNAREFDSKAGLVEELLKALHTNAYVLVKGSRFTAMDEVVSALLPDSTRNANGNSTGASLC